MKRISIAMTAIAALLGTPALAAELPLKAPPPPPPLPAWSWTGIYIGGQAGAAWGRSDETYDLVPNTPAFLGTQNYDISGPMAGGVIGANYQIGSLVVGVEGEFNWSRIDGSSGVIDIGPPNLGDTFYTDVESYQALKGRIGFAAWDRALLYIDGGAAWGQVVHQYNDPPPFGGPGISFSATNNETGWIIGGGFEYALSPNWSARIEYDYVALGTGVIQYSAIPANSSTWTDDFSVVKLGVNYRFNWGGPIATGD